MAASSKIMTLVLLATLVVIGSSLLVSTSEGVTQPIKYNHRLHVEQEGLECIDCHVYAEEMPFATIPGVEICTDCHDEDALSDSVEELKLIEYIKSDSTIPWVQIYRVPDHVYFSHRRHVVLGEVSCSKCHGNVAEQSVPVQKPQSDMTMEWCIDCHRENKVSNDCLACHR